MAFRRKNTRRVQQHAFARRAVSVAATPHAHVVSVNRQGPDVARWTFDTAIDDPASAADLSVNGDGPLSYVGVSDFVLDATYNAIGNNATWAATDDNGEPTFVGGVTLQPASGPLDNWV